MRREAGTEEKGEEEEVEMRKEEEEGSRWGKR